eukprot:6469316-Amphidinium_carterae.1
MRDRPPHEKMRNGKLWTQYGVLILPSRSRLQSQTFSCARTRKQFSRGQTGFSKSVGGTSCCSSARGSNTRRPSRPSWIGDVGSTFSVATQNLAGSSFDDLVEGLLPFASFDVYFFQEFCKGEVGQHMLLASGHQVVFGGELA